MLPNGSHSSDKNVPLFVADLPRSNIGEFKECTLEHSNTLSQQASSQILLYLPRRTQPGSQEWEVECQSIEQGLAAARDLIR